jgi:hypothetical protein
MSPEVDAQNCPLEGWKRGLLINWFLFITHWPESLLLHNFRFVQASEE